MADELHKHKGWHKSMAVQYIYKVLSVNIHTGTAEMLERAATRILKGMQTRVHRGLPDVPSDGAMLYAPARDRFSSSEWDSAGHRGT